MLLKVRSGWAFLLALVVLVTMVIPNWGPKVQAANQAQITAAMGAGWNLGNQLEANDGNGNPSETVWGNPTITPALITAVKNAGFKTIRIPFSLLNKIGPAPSYTIDAAWLARIKEVVGYAYSQGLYILIDLHGDGYHTITGGWLLVTSSDQTAIRAKYKAVWQQIATTFASYDEHLIFESMNEVFDGDWNDPEPAHYANLNAYNQIFVDTVRQAGGNNTTRWLLIPGWNTNIDYTVGNYGFVVPTDNYRSSSIPSNEKRIMISAHYYDPYDFTLDNNSQITQWGSIATDPSRKSTWGQEDFMDSQLAKMYNKFVTQGYPVVIGEYCVTDKTDKDSTNNTYRAYFAKTLCTDCKKYGAVPVYWDMGHNGVAGSGLIDRSTYAITQPGIINAIMSGMGGSTNTPTPTRATPTPTRGNTPTPTRTSTPTPTLPGGTTNLAVNKTASADSQQSNNIASYGNDGSASTRWCANDSGLNHWWKVDLGQSYNITGSEVTWEFAANYKYRIETSTDNSTWTTNADKTGNTGSAQVQSDSFSASARYVRITVTGLASSSWASFFEFKVFGGGSSTPTPTQRVTPSVTRRGTATATPTRRVTPTPTSRRVTTATPTGTGGYVVTYTISSDWGTGGNVDVTIKNNTTTAVNGWTLAWTFPGAQTITNLWNGTYTQSGASVSVKDAGYNGAIGALGGTTSFGFGMNYSGTNAKPTAFTLNGTACTVE